MLLDSADHEVAFSEIRTMQSYTSSKLNLDLRGLVYTAWLNSISSFSSSSKFNQASMDCFPINRFPRGDSFEADQLVPASMLT